jgi:RHS repeat-associated protein
VGGGVENTESYKSNRAGQRTALTNRNGTVHAYTHDLLGRLTLDDVTTLGSGVDGTVRKLETSYNDQGLFLLLTSKDGSGTVLNQVKRTYNGLGQLIEEEQEHDGAVDGSTLSVQYAHSEMSGGANHSRLTSMTYPDGNVLAYAYDAGLDSTISRLSKLTWDGTDVESYEHLGLSTVVERDRPEADHTLTYVKQGMEGVGDAGDQYTGLDRFGRIVDQRWILDAGGHADRFTYGHDRSGNRLWRKNELSSTHSELYMADAADEQAAYDKLDRLVEFQRGTLSDAVGSDGYYDTVSTSSRRQQWDLDALGNWDSLTNDGGSAQTRTHDIQNRIATVSGATSPVHSANGEMTSDETGQTLKYDAWGMIVEINVDGTGSVEIAYAYDALHRRISRNSNDFYYTSQWQQIEERDAQGVEAQFVWSPVYADAMVLRDRDSDSDGVMEATDERLYVVHDANFNVNAVLDDSGTVVERYIYEAYGTRTVLDANWTADSDGASDYGFKHGHQGGKHDFDAGLVHFRNRDMDTSLGRWTRQDPLGYLGGNNFYEAYQANPLISLDSLGLCTEPDCTTCKKTCRDYQHLIQQAATVICREDGCRCLCVRLDVYPEGDTTPGAPEERECLFTNEHTDANNPLYNCDCNRRGGYPCAGGWYGNDVFEGDCESTTAEVECLLDRRLRCARRGDQQCVERLSKRIDFLVDNARQQYDCDVMAILRDSNRYPPGGRR